MKKLLSLFLVLCLLLSVAGCAASGDSLQAPPEDIAPSGTTEPLFWPPLPLETEQTTAPAQEQTEPSEQTRPADTQPVTRPADDDTEATYYPREDQDDEDPRYTEPSETTQPQTEPVTEPETVPPTTQAPSSGLDPNGSYDSKNDVALFIVTYGRLPNNYITKKQAERLGWSGGSLERYAPGKCIGGDRFYNREGLLPAGHTYYECDIGTLGANSRGAQRIVYSTDGLVYYTYNHYKSFTLLYGNP